MRIILGSNALAGYPQGGGLWSIYLQYLLGLRALGHDVFLLEVLRRSPRPELDRRGIGIFLERLRRWGFGNRSALLLYDGEGGQTIGDDRLYGMAIGHLREIIHSADVLWNFHHSIRRPLLDEFKFKALLDLDPGILQISALTRDLDIHEHDLLFTVGLNMSEETCEVPRLGLQWQPFLPPVYLPMWEASPLTTDASAITSVVHWNWGAEFHLDGRIFNDSKREAYLRFIDLPCRCSANFLLAASIRPNDVTGDRELLTQHRWKLVHPYECALTVASYQRFIRDSMAEFNCAKSVYTGLRTGWFSDRSAAYLASGRPVLAEDTGFADHLPTGLGLLSFRTLDQAAEAVDELLANYPRHQKAAREIAESCLSAEHVLERMVESCGYA
jgi:hypothetical protein